MQPSRYRARLFRSMTTSVELVWPPRIPAGRPILLVLPVCGWGEPVGRWAPVTGRTGPICLIRPCRGGRLGRMGLSERDRAILEFEGSWWTEPGRKEAAIRARLGISASRYRQILAGLLDSEEAANAAPLVIRRLRRERERRRRARFEGRPAGGRKSF